MSTAHKEVSLLSEVKRKNEGFVPFPAGMMSKWLSDVAVWKPTTSWLCFPLWPTWCWQLGSYKEKLQNAWPHRYPEWGKDSWSHTHLWYDMLLRASIMHLGHDYITAVDRNSRMKTFGSASCMVCPQYQKSLALHKATVLLTGRWQAQAKDQLLHPNSTVVCHSCNCVWNYSYMMPSVHFLSLLRQWWKLKRLHTFFKAKLPSSISTVV